MALITITSITEETKKTGFITVYQPVSGWKAVQYWWNEEDEIGGFWEPYQTGFCAFSSKEQAIEDAQFWADSDNIPFYLGSETKEAK